MSRCKFSVVRTITFGLETCDHSLILRDILQRLHVQHMAGLHCNPAIP